MKAYLVLSIFAILLIGCSEKKVEPLMVGEMNEYRDPGYGFHIKYPKDWKQFGAAGKAVFAQSQDVIEKFQNPTGGIEGTMVTVEVIPTRGTTADAVVQKGKEDLKQTWQSLEIKPDTPPMSVAGKQTPFVRYSVAVSAKKHINGVDMYVTGDTAVYKFSQLFFGDEQVTMYTPIMNEMVNSFEVPTVVKKSDAWVVSSNLETYPSNFFTMQYPDNLNIVPVKKGAKDDLAMEMRADRLDCSIHIDVFGAQKLTVDKVWEQNKNAYHAKSSDKTTIGGEPAIWADYSPRKDINSRVYFIVKNDKVIRTTINYYSPQKEIYFTVFENMVKSMKLK
jgi:hypothetical protein